MTAWHFTPQPADLPIEQVREWLYHTDMSAKRKMIHGKIFWDDTHRLHVLDIIIESLGTDAVERFIQQHRQPVSDA